MNSLVKIVNLLLVTGMSTLAIVASNIPETARADSASDTTQLISVRIQSHTLTNSQQTVDTISITCNTGGKGIAGFDFTLAYDHEVFDLVDALPGSFLDSCHWEYFMGRDNPKCPGPCPAGLFKIVALARFKNEDSSSVCFAPPAGAEIAKLLIRRRPRGLNEAFVGVPSEPLRFFWIDCGDNSISSVSGNDLFLCRVVSDADGAPLPQNIYTQFPNYTGPTGSCLDSRRENAPRALLRLTNAIIVAPPIESPPAADSVTE